MHTAHFCGSVGGGTVPSGYGSGGYSAGGMTWESMVGPGGAKALPSPSVDGQIYACKNITFLQFRLQAVNICDNEVNQSALIESSPSTIIINACYS